MKKKWWIGLTAACALLLISIFGEIALAQAAPEEPVTTVNGLEVEILWSGTHLVRIGRETPVTVRASSTGPEISGTVSAYIPISSEKYYVIEKELAVAAGEQNQVVISIPVDYYTTEVLVEYRDVRGTLYASETLNIRPSYDSQEIYVGVISSNVKDLAVFDQVLLNEYRGTTTRLFDFQKDTLPRDAEELKQYDVFLWDDIDLSEITAEQITALNNWVYEGGVFIAGNNNDFGKEAETGEMERESWGRGEYVYCGFSLQDIASAEAGEEEIQSFLIRAIGADRLASIEESIDYGYNDYWSGRSITINVDLDRLPSVWLYVVVLVVYLILLGPVLYFTLKKKGRRDLLRGGMVVLSLLFTGIIYLMGSKTRFTGPFMSYASIQEIRGDTVMETVFANFSSPYNKEYSFQIAGSYQVSPLLNYDYSGGAADIENTDCQLRIEYGSEKTQVTIHDEIAFTSEVLRLTRNDENEYGNGFEGELKLFRGVLEGYLINTTSEDFEDVCILAGERMVRIGDMAAGEQVDLSQLETVSASGHSKYTLPKKMTEADQYKDINGSKESALAEWRSQVIYYYMNYVMTEAKLDAVILAFPASEENSFLLEGDVDVRGTTLVTVLLDVDYTKNGQVYVPFFESNPVVLQGNYDAAWNSTYVEQTVIQYDFGDYRISSLLAEWPEEREKGSYLQSFQGSMYFYNGETRTYDKMECKEEYSWLELENYLDEENRLTVRYDCEMPEEYMYEMLLPAFSIVGKEVP